MTDKPDKPAKKQLVIKVDRERIAEMTVRDLLEYQENPTSLKAKVSLVSMFAMNGDDAYLPPEKAREAVKEMTVRQLNETITAIYSQLQETAAPNE
jgi:hypothetical protein